MENARIADLLDEIGDLLELKDENPFRIRAYRSAAQSVRNQADRLEDLAAQGQDLSRLPDIGEATSKKIHEMLETGTCQRLETLREEVPAGLPELLRVPALGPRKAMQLYRELGVDSLDALRRACEAGRVRELDGMGEKTEAKILQGIRTVRRTEGRVLYQDAADQLDALGAYLDGLRSIDRWDVAGSYRRGRETVGDLDILIHASDRRRAADGILEYESITETIGRGEERVSVRLNGGLQVDFRFFDEPAFGAALMYFTGSKAHNIKVRRLAQERGWKLNEYGLFKEDHRLAGKTEKSVYKRLDMRWVPPELREDRGEIEAAREGPMPRLIEQDQVRGDLQCHTTASDGKQTIREMAQAARDFGFDYLAITDHSKRVTMAGGLDDDAALRHADAIRKADAELKRFWLLAGIEVDILKSGELDLKEKTLAELDWVVASVHYDREMSRRKMTDRIVAAVKSGVVHCLGHPLGRIIGRRDPLDVDMDRIMEACAGHGVRLEINCQPDRLDLPDTFCRDARLAGVGFTLGTDAHSRDGFRFIRLGVNTARRGWLRKGDVLNTKTLTELRKILG
ncbi:MAG: DNA polymerase/3'-5' exonuclease PolX [Lentisphaerae bacterium]|nr:DNA polymerase/3'-5' exonuclease PolX [Lentisphaerota bacterium]